MERRTRRRIGRRGAQPGDHGRPADAPPGRGLLRPRRARRAGGDEGGDRVRAHRLSHCARAARRDPELHRGGTRTPCSARSRRALRRSSCRSRRPRRHAGSFSVRRLRRERGAARGARPRSRAATAAAARRSFAGVDSTSRRARRSASSARAARARRCRCSRSWACCRRRARGSGGQVRFEGQDLRRAPPRATAASCAAASSRWSTRTR